MQHTPSRFCLGFIRLMVLGMLPALGGCDSAEPPSSVSTVSSPSPDDDPDVFRPPPGRKIPSPARPKAPPPPPAGGSSDKTKDGRQAKASSLPDQVSRWEDHDFSLAWEKGDRRLTLAVQTRAENPRQTAEEAKMLASLLEEPVPGKTIAVPPAMRVGLIRVVTAALGANGTKPASQTLRDLLQGKISASDQQAAVEGALAALLHKDSAEDEEIILQTILASVQPGFSVNGAPSAGSINKNLVNIVRENASARMRTRMAEALVRASDDAVQDDLFLKMLCEPEPKNWEAQVLIYQSRRADPKTRELFERQFIPQSREAMRVFFGFAAPASAKPLHLPEERYPAVERLWCAPFIDFLDLQHRELTTLMERPSSVVLAAAVPNPLLRSKLRQTISRHWSEGPQAFRAADTGDGILAEPGFLTALKSVARENRVQTSSNYRPVKAGKSSSLPGRESDGRRRSAVAAEWDKLTEKVMRNYCRESHRAALDRMADAFRSGAAPSRQSLPEDLPVKTYRSGDVDIVFSLDWPAAQVRRLPQLADDKLRLAYVRAEHRAKVDPLLASYRRQMKSLTEHPFPDGVWLDSLVEAEKGSRLQSVDVLVTRTNADLSLPGSQEQGLTVEILFIEVPNLRR